MTAPVAFYNDTEPFVCDWLEALIAEGLIADGVVDRRSIADIEPSDLDGFAQCHFFAGIGGWSLALRMAGWPDDRPVWTGSCPCQPFSSAGKRLGVDDERHVWPSFFRLIAERSPPVVLGEQVASADGRVWLAGVHADLERVGYAVGAADLCAAGAGAPHIRQRLFWLGDARGPRSPQQRGGRIEPSGSAETVRDHWSDCRLVECREPTRGGGTRTVYRRVPPQPGVEFALDGISGIMGDRWDEWLSRLEREVIAHAEKAASGPGEVLRAMWGEAHAQSVQRGAGGPGTIPEPSLLLFALCELARRPERKFHLAAQDIRAIQEETLRALRQKAGGRPAPSCPPQERGLEGPSAGESGNALYRVSPEDPHETIAPVQRLRPEVQAAGHVPEALPAMEEVWRPALDEAEDAGITKRFRACPGVADGLRLFPLCASVPGRVGTLRGAGNAIVPQVAAEFVMAFMDRQEEST